MTQAREFVDDYLERIGPEYLAIIKSDKRTRQNCISPLVNALGKNDYDLPKYFSQGDAMAHIQSQLNLLDSAVAHPEIAGPDTVRMLIDEIQQLSIAYHLYFFT